MMFQTTPRALVTTAVALLALAIAATGALTTSPAEAQTRPQVKKVNPKQLKRKKTPTPKTTRRPRPTGNIGDRLGLKKGQCHQQLYMRPQEGQYKMMCTSGEHNRKTFICSGGRIIPNSNPTRYRQYRCVSSRVTNHYVLGRPTGGGGSFGVDRMRAADFTCGCTRIAVSCSGGTCRGTE